MKVEIKKPDAQHAEKISEICSAGWRQTVAGILSEAHQLQNIAFWYNPERVRQDIGAGVYSYIALVENEVAGVIGGGMTAAGTAEVFVLYMDERFRYKGIGRKLLDALTRDQKAQGAVVQWVSVQEGNQLGIPFYEARGFKFQGKKTEETDTGELQVSLRYSRPI